MKKVLTVLLMALMVVNMSVAAFAAPGSFIVSPSTRPDPELIEGNPESDDCNAQVIITPYADRATLPDDLRALIEDAYAQFVAATDLTTFNADLAALAKQKGIPATDLAVSDLFDIRYEGCPDHKEHGYFNITMKAETLDRFVGLLHYHNGEWELIKNAEVVVTADGEYQLKFNVAEFSPFAIVVNTGDMDPKPPQAGMSSMIPVYGSIMIVSAIAIVLIAKKSKKQEA